MRDKDKTKEQLINELGELRQRIIVLESIKVDSKQAKRQIRIANERLEYLLSSTTAVIYTAKVSDDYATTFISTNVQQMVGYEKQHFLEESTFWINHVHPEDVQRILYELPRILEQELYTYEYRFKRKDGTYIWVRDEMKLVKNEKGEPIEIVGYWANISDLKETEEELKKTNNYLDNIIESSLDAIVVSDSMGYLSKVNNSFLKLTGYNEEELIGKHISELTPYEERVYDSTTEEMVEIDENFIVDAADITGNKLFEEGKITNWDSYYLRKDQKIVPVEINITYLYNENGEIIGSVGINRDITERRKIERALRKSHQKLEEKVEKRTATLKLANEQLRQEITQRKETEKGLKESEERYQRLIDTANDAIFIVDAETGIILNANKKAGELLGIPPEKIIGMHHTGMHAKEDEAYYRKLFYDNAQKEGGIILDDIFVWHRNGYRIPVEISSSAVKVGGIMVMQGIFRDITERKKAEEKLIQNQEQLRSLASQLTKVEEQERRNIASYLHDHLGQELFAMKLQLEQMKKSPANHTIKDLESVIERTNHMMSNMRSMSYQLSPPILYELGLEAALEWIVEEMRTLRATTITFHDNGKPKPLDETMKALLFQAVRELLNNVTKHAKAQNAEVSVARDNAMVVIQVNDDGIGFEGSEADKSKEKNQGFGLYSIRERLRHSGGDLTVESALNRGTKITLKAPLKS